MLKVCHHLLIDKINDESLDKIKRREFFFRLLHQARPELASITIRSLSTILKNYREIIEKSFQKGREFDTKCRPKGGQNVLWKTEMSKFPWILTPPPPSPILGQSIDRCISRYYQYFDDVIGVFLFSVKQCHQCSKYASCVNNVCTCNHGYTGNGQQCQGKPRWSRDHTHNYLYSNNYVKLTQKYKFNLIYKILSQLSLHQIIASFKKEAN